MDKISSITNTEILEEPEVPDNFVQKLEPARSLGSVILGDNFNSDELNSLLQNTVDAEGTTTLSKEDKIKDINKVLGKSANRLPKLKTIFTSLLGEDEGDKKFKIMLIKINFYIKHFKKFFSDRNIFIAREMTKKHETYIRQSIEKIAPFKTQLKGELTIVISKKNKKKLLTTDYVKIEKQVIKYLKSYTVKDIVDLISKKEQVPKKIIYNLCIKNKK